ncbi:LuxR family transcriptional regulator [Mycobacterium decipiens]|nr:LuxR family transcriptional regulator [Mycobacterium decipiens]
MVTLLLADVEESTRLWQAQPEEMAAAVARLDHTVSEAITIHGGVQPIEQGEGDSFVVAFARASDAAACALDLQRASLAPIRLRMGLHTGEVQLRDQLNYVGPTINRTARLRDLAHGGQIVLSATTGDLISDWLPTDAWLVDLGRHPLRDLPRPEWVMQLCHPDLRERFPPLRTAKAVAASVLPAQFTTFVGRHAQMNEVRALLAENRLVTLCGTGGVGKTRLAIQIAGSSEFRDGLCYVDLAPITESGIVPSTAARSVGLPDQPGRSTMDTLRRFIGNRRMLMVLDNCEHLLDASAALVVELLGVCPALTILATSREPIGVAGEITWRVPSMSVADEAIELFADRASRVQPGFTLANHNAAAVREICRRLDGIPLAIEFAAARVRSMSPVEIADGLDDRFRLLAGSVRGAVQRQQTLRASIDWSHALLTETEQILFRRLAPFVGGFDLAAARAVAAAGTDLEPFQVLDQLTLLVDKSLVVVEERQGRTRYRLLETVRRYALEKLGDSGEADVRARHRDHYTALAARLNTPAENDHQRLVARAETEIDNLRAAFAWSRESGQITEALQLASSLQPIWFGRAHLREGLAWFDSILEDPSINQLAVSTAVRARALADKAMLGTWLATSPVGATDIIAPAQQALAMARDVGDPAVLVRALTAYGCSSGYNAEAAAPYFAEATDLARAIDDKWTLCQILYWRGVGICISGDPNALRAAAEECRDLADTIGDRFVSRHCTLWFSLAQMWTGNLTEAIELSNEVTAEAEASNDVVTRVLGLYTQAQVLAYRGASAAHATAAACIEAATELGGVYQGIGYAALTFAALATGDIAAAVEASEAARPILSAQSDQVTMHQALMAQLALAGGDAITAQHFANDAVLATNGWHRMVALTTRARVAIARGDPDLARDDAHAALACGAPLHAYQGMPDAMELLAGLAGEVGSHQEAARLFGAAAALRQETTQVRFKTWDPGYEASVAALRDAMGGEDFDRAWAEGAALSTDEAIAYAQRGRGERKRPARGWGALTPTEHNVVRLASEGLSNKDIAKRLFVSPRTVQTHLTHVYAKLGLTSRIQLVDEAVRRS